MEQDQLRLNFKDTLNELLRVNKTNNLTIDKVINEIYDLTFRIICNIDDNDLHDLLIEFKDVKGKTLKISWAHSQKRLAYEK